MNTKQIEEVQQRVETDYEQFASVSSPSQFRRAVYDVKDLLTAEKESRQREQRLREAAEELLFASLVQDTCPHDSEPDICDGCAYTREKAIGRASSALRAALAAEVPK